MNPESQRALLTLIVFAAFADGEKHAREHEAIRRIAESLAGEAAAPDLMLLTQDVLLRRASVAQSAAVLTEPAHRQLAYEMALAVCEADGAVSEAERAFLDELRAALALNGAEAARIEREAHTLTQTLAPMPAAASSALAPSAVDETALDKSILNYSLLNGALELLPQSWATMAILPLQIKMVYEIGRAYGITLDQGHVKEFIAAAGVGLTSQYLEQFGRKLLGGLLGKAVGKTVGKVGGVATDMAFSFATTYALGQLAKRYYAGGRTMNAALLKETFQGLLGPAKQIQAQYLPQIQTQAANLDMAQVMRLVRGG